MYVIQPLTKVELEKIFDKNAITILEYFIKKAIFSQPEEMINQKKLPIQIPKEHIEQRIAQALNAKSIGAWSYPVDIISSDSIWWADVKMLSAKVNKHWMLTSNDSWETSLWQNFKDVGDSLDYLFKENNLEQIKTLWIELIKRKLSIPKKEHWVEIIYYFILLRGWDNLFLLWMKIDETAFDNVTINHDRSSQSSVFLQWYINDQFGSVKIYKAKKRMELRLNPKQWQESWLLIHFPLSLSSNQINIRDYVLQWWDISELGKENASKIFD